MQRGITWTFNPSATSRMDGFWERQIRSIRRILVTVLRSRLVSDNELSILIAKVKGILNSRPVFNPEGNEPLTPTDLLL